MKNTVLLTIIFVCSQPALIQATHYIYNATPSEARFFAKYATIFCKDNQGTIQPGQHTAINPKACSLSFLDMSVRGKSSRYNGPYGASGIDGTWAITGPFGTREEPSEDNPNGRFIPDPAGEYVVTRIVQ